MADKTTLSVATANWAVDMLRRVGKPTDDVFLSPVSIAVALGMTYAGADTSTAQQFNDVLFKGLTEAEVHNGFGRLVAALNAPKDGYELRTANKLFGQQGFALLSAFTDTLHKHYQSELKSVDFKTNADGVATEINKWVEEVTNNKITNLLAQGVLNSMTRLVLVNAVYFKGQWQNEFDANDTFKQQFFCTPDKEKSVDMMHQSKHHLYHETYEVQVLGLHYRRTDIDMFVILPKERYGLAKFEKNLTGQKLIELLDATSVKEVDVALPKFKLECQFSLGDHLKAMGMSEAFSDRADFSRITGSKDLYISAVIHKAFVEVDEQGSEAAAATAVAIACMSAQINYGDPPPSFVADHPFLIVFADRSSDTGVGHLFLGRFAGAN